MAKIGLIITLGTRDIQFKTEEIENFLELKNITDTLRNDDTRKSFKEPRIGGQLLLDNFDKYRDITLYPLVKSAIDYANDQNPDEIQIVFIATDQDSLNGSEDKQKQKHYNSDSINFAKLLVEKILPNEINAKLDYVSIDGDILQLDLMFTAFRNSKPFKEYLDRLNKECEKVILFTQGGIGGLNNALMLHSILFFEEKLQVLGLKEGETEAHEQKVTEQFLKMFQVKQAKKLIERYDYAGFEALTMLPKETIAVAKYSSYRLNYNFIDALSVLEKEVQTDFILKNKNQVKNLVQSQNNDIITPEEFSTALNSQQIEFTDLQEILKELQQKKKETPITPEQEKLLLNELYWNSAIKLKQSSYVDFLLRIFRIVEGKLRLLCEKYIASFSKINDFKFQVHGFESDLIKIFEKDSEFKTFLEKKWKGKNQYKFTMKDPDIVTYLTVLEYCSKSESKFNENERTQIDKKRKFFWILQGLTELRNNSIGAHSYSRTSLEDIDKQIMDLAGKQFKLNGYSVIDLLVHLKSILNDEVIEFSTPINIDLKTLLKDNENPFDEINEWLLKELDNITY